MLSAADHALLDGKPVVAHACIRLALVELKLNNND